MAGLKKDATLHHFQNAAGELYAAIYLGRVEQMSCPRFQEYRMIKQWNESNG